MIFSDKKRTLTTFIIILGSYFAARLSYGGFTYHEEPVADFESTKSALSDYLQVSYLDAYVHQIEDLNRYPKLPPVKVPSQSEAQRYCSAIYRKNFLEDGTSLESGIRRENKMSDAARAKLGPVRPLTSYDFNENYWSEYRPVVFTHYRYKKGRAKMPSTHEGEYSLEQKVDFYISSLRLANDAWEKAVTVERLAPASSRASFYRWRQSSSVGQSVLVADLAVRGVYVSVCFNEIIDREIPIKMDRLLKAQSALGDKPMPRSAVVLWFIGAFWPLADCFHCVLMLALIYISLLRWSSE